MLLAGLFPFLLGGKACRWMPLSFKLGLAGISSRTGSLRLVQETSSLMLSGARIFNVNTMCDIHGLARIYAGR